MTDTFRNLAPRRVDAQRVEHLHALFLTVACPRCRAAVGEPCVIRNGPPGRVVHLPRQDRAVRADNRAREARR